MVSEDRANELYSLDKVIREDLSWTQNGKKGSQLRLETNVECLNENVDMTLRAWYKTKTGNYGFCLFYGSSNLIRRWDNGSKHTNPNGEQIPPPHKHKWSEKYEETIAYVPDDYVNPEDVDEGLQDFLDECNIEHEGAHQRYRELGGSS